MEGFRAASAFVEVSARLDDRQVLDAARRAVDQIDTTMTDGAEDTGRSMSDTLGRSGEESGRNFSERASKRIGDERGRFTTVGKTIGTDSSSSFVSGFGSKLGPGMADALSSSMMTAGIPAMIALSPTIGAVMSSAVAGGAAGVGIVGGVVMAARDPRVKEAGKSLGQFVMADLEKKTQAFIPATLDAIGKIRAGWSAMGPDLERIFRSSHLIDPLVTGAISGGQKIVRGIADAVGHAGPAIDAFGRMFDGLGDATGRFFSTLSGDAEESASAIDDLTNSMVSLMDTATLITHYAAQIKGGADAMDTWIDKGRYMYEDMVNGSERFKTLGLQIDLTADGFKYGSVEAEAYRAATLGTAEAADFMVLKAAGMTDAQIAAADASGTYRQKMAAAGQSTKGTAGAMLEVSDRTMLLNRSMGEAIDQAGGLSAAFKILNGGALNAREAESAYQAAIDDVSKSIKENGKTLDLHTAKGRANDKAIRNLIATTDQKAQATYDEVKATKGSAAAQDAARKVYADGRAQLIKNLTTILGNKEAAVALANKIMAIPKSWGTDVNLTDKASAKAAAIKASIERINGRTVVVAVKYEVHGSVPGEHHIGEGTLTKNRWGGVYQKAAVGLLRDANVYAPQAPGRYMIAEPETGGEAFIPKYGDRRRNMAILQQAASWNKASVVPDEARGRSGPSTVNHFAPGSIVLDASKIRDVADLIRMIQNLVPTARAMGAAA